MCQLGALGVQTLPRDDALGSGYLQRCYRSTVANESPAWMQSAWKLDTRGRKRQQLGLNQVLLA